MKFMVNKKSPRWGLCATVLLCSMLVGAFWQTGTAHAASTTYYVDCSQSSNGSGTQASPWNSLSAVDSYGTFNPGDTILFKQGTSCSGMLDPQGSGTSSSPITISSYAGSSTAAPIIDGGTNDAAIEFSNQQYWTIENLEVRGGNYRVIYITGNTANTTFSGFTLTNLVVHDTAHFPTTGTWYTGAGGVIFDPCNTTTVLNNIVLNNVVAYHTFAQGIQIGHEHDAEVDSTCGAVANYQYSVTNVTIENLTSYAHGAAGAAMYNAQNVLVENNTFYDNGFYGVHGEGSWSQFCDNCVWRNNESYDNHLGDGGGFDMDGNTTNSTVEYNYSHDNQGYCVSAFAIAETGYIDPTNNTIRDNVCARNDTGVTSAYTDSGDIFLSTFGTSGSGVIGNQFNGIAIYNNTIYGDQNTSKLPSLSLQTTGNASMFTGSNPDFFKNNIIYAVNPFMVGTDNNGMSLDYNLYWDTAGTPTFGYNASSNTTVNYTSFASYQSGSGQDAHSSVANPLLNGPTYHIIGIPVYAYTLQPSSPALGTGTLISNNGGQDFYGNNVSSSSAPNIGAYNGSAIANGGPSNDWVECAPEGGTCAFSGTEQVAFGAGGKFNYLTLIGGTACNDTVFGDPNKGVVKACYIDVNMPQGSWTQCATEGGTCSVTGTEGVAFGANGLYFYTTATSGFTCATSTFGDPAYGIVKACYLSTSVIPPSSGSWTLCASEGKFCDFDGTKTIAFGANGHYNTATVTNGSVCNNTIFGDPDVGVVKSCYYK